VNVAPAARPGWAGWGTASSSARATTWTYSIGRGNAAANAVGPPPPVASRAWAATRKNAAAIKGQTDQRWRTQTNNGSSSTAPAPQNHVGEIVAQMPVAVPATTGSASPTIARRRGDRGRRHGSCHSSSIQFSTLRAPENLPNFYSSASRRTSRNRPAGKIDSPFLRAPAILPP